MVDDGDIEAAWSEVRARWDDEGAHRAFLERCADLAGLAEAGGRYRAVLDAHPGDPVALRWRDEVVKRASALALAQLPRTTPRRTLSPGARKALLLSVVVASVAACAWVLLRIAQLGGR